MAEETFVVTRHDFAVLQRDILDRITTAVGTQQTDEDIITALVAEGWEEVIVRRAMTQLKRGKRIIPIRQVAP